MKNQNRVVPIPAPAGGYTDSNFDEFQIEGAIPSLIREWAQNAQDAGATRLTIRLGFAKGDDVRSMWDGLRPHLVEAAKLDTAINPREFDREYVRYAVLEDDGHGLLGDVSDTIPIDGESNDWTAWNFGGGQTTKKSGKQGSRGRGKLAYEVVSEIRTIATLTTRNASKLVGRPEEGLNGPYLLGRSDLKGRLMGDGEKYAPQVFLGETYQTKSGPAALPIEDAETVAQFRKMFGIDREGGQHGTSIVIVALKDKVADTFELTKQAVRSLWMAINNGLEVRILTPEKEVIFNTTTLLGIAENCGCEETPYIRLKRAESSVQKLSLALPSGFASADSAKGLVAADQAEVESARKVWTSGDGLNVTVHVPSSGGESLVTVLMQPTEDKKSYAPRVYRDNLYISRAADRDKAAAYSIVQVADSPLAANLRSSENAAHSEFLLDRVKEQEKDSIRFVKSIMSAVLAIVQPTSDEPDFDCFANLFPVESEAVKDKPEIKKDGETVLPPAPPTSTPSACFITDLQRDKGFAIRANPKYTLPLPSELIISVDTVGSGGDYNDFDFRPGTKSGQALHIQNANCNKEVLAANRIKLYGLADGFELVVKGFDRNRKLYVRAEDPSRPEEAAE